MGDHAAAESSDFSSGQERAIDDEGGARAEVWFGGVQRPEEPEPEARGTQ